MNIEIVDNNGNLGRFIPASSIAHIQFGDGFARIQFAEGCWIDKASPAFFVIGSSRSRLIHAIESGITGVVLESQFLTEREFKKYSSQPLKIAGLLEGSAPLVIGGVC